MSMFVIRVTNWRILARVAQQDHFLPILTNQNLGKTISPLAICSSRPFLVSWLSQVVPPQESHARPPRLPWRASSGEPAKRRRVTAMRSCCSSHCCKGMPQSRYWCLEWTHSSPRRSSHSLQVRECVHQPLKTQVRWTDENKEANCYSVWWEFPCLGPVFVSSGLQRHSFT